MMAISKNRLTLASILSFALLAGGPSHAAVVVGEGSLFSFDGVNGPLVPSGVVPSNLATDAGSIAFAISSLPGFAIHATPNLNDGVYGNSNSWIAGSSRPIDVSGDGVADLTTAFAGIDLAGSGLYNITSFAFGRSNRANEWADRTAGTYFIQITTTPNPDAATLDSNWTTIGSINITTSNFGDTYRHLYTMGSAVQASGLRVVVPNVATCIDEIEIYGVAVPEPTSLVLLGLGVAGLGLSRRKKVKSE